MVTSDLDIEQMHAAAGAATSMLRVMANEDRLLLLCQLTQGELCVSELEQLLHIRQPTLSQQLAILRNEGIVSTRREGKRIYYQVSDQRAVALLATLYGQYCPAPAAIHPRHRRHEDAPEFDPHHHGQPEKAEHGIGRTGIRSKRS